jgi:hypothetical protein
MAAKFASPEIVGVVVAAGGAVASSASWRRFSVGIRKAPAGLSFSTSFVRYSVSGLLPARCCLRVSMWPASAWRSIERVEHRRISAACRLVSHGWSVVM